MSGLGKLFVTVRRIFGSIGQQILPTVSPIDGNVVPSSGAISAEHWQKLEFLGTSVCDCCGIPLAQSFLPQTWCGACEAKSSKVSRTRSALVYSEMSKRLILSFKHGGRSDNIKVFASWIHLAAEELLGEPGVLVPVPLHLYRRLHRRFNQSALLAGCLAKTCKLPVQPQWLIRTRNTPSQGFKSTTGRNRNVQGAFLVPQRFCGQVKGQRIILVDDVRTSGATLEACAKALLNAGAAQVDAVTLARIVKPVEVST